MAVNLKALIEPPVARAWGEVLLLGIMVFSLIYFDLVGWGGWMKNLLLVMAVTAFIANAWGNSIYILKKVFGMIGSFENLGSKKHNAGDNLCRKENLKHASERLGSEELSSA